MKSKVISIILTLLIISMSLYGCANANNSEEMDRLKNELKLKEDSINLLTSKNEELQKKLSDLKQQMSKQSNAILNQALIVINLLKNKDMNSLESHIHPNKGVRFTPYSYINLQNDLVFSSVQIVSLLQSSQVYTWGEYDGTGDPIQDTFSDYYDKFVYDVDFANPHMIGNNVVIGTGNLLNNIAQVYPNEVFVEFHFTGFDTQYAGMDWKSLRLVFEDVNGTWYLVGIIHDQWTI